ncbi:MAG: DHH family phosphoesterase [Nitrososphaerota archaeon]
MEKFFKDIENSIKKIKDFEGKEAFIIHHDEADGICSAAIIKKTLEDYGFSIKTLCLEKLFPEVIEKLHSKNNLLYIYTDIGSAHVEKISKINEEKNLIIILDHHDTTYCDNPLIHNINPELYGLSGEKDASASTIAYFFSKKFNEKNKKLSYLAIIGSAEIPMITGLNKEVIKDALNEKIIEISKTKTGEDIKILSLGNLSYKRLSSLLSIVGSVGYYKGGPEKGIKICLEGIDEKTENEIKKLEEERKEANKKMLSQLYKKGLEKLSHIQWFHAKDNFKGMGTKVIGSFCSYLSFQKRIVDQNKYLIGIMNMSSIIPNFGNLEKNYVKVSARAPKQLSILIERNKALPLSKILPEACNLYDGFADGHSIAASGIILSGKEKEFVKKLDELAGGR